MVEDIIQVESLDGGSKTAETGAADRIGVDVPPKAQLSDLVVIPGLPVINVKPDHRAVQAQIVLLPRAFVLVPEVQVLYVKRITEEYPTPAEVRTDTHRGLRSKGDALSA